MQKYKCFINEAYVLLEVLLDSTYFFEISSDPGFSPPILAVMLGSVCVMSHDNVGIVAPQNVFFLH